MSRIAVGARARIERARDQQEKTVAAIRRGNPMDAEWDRTRALMRVEARARMMPRQAVATIASEVSERLAEPTAVPERIWGATEDFVGVAFLQRGANAARSVGRVAFRDGRPQGTGFLISPGLFLTNNHVLETPSDCRSFVVEFDYEVGVDGRQREASRFALEPDALFITDDRDDLDYTVVALGRRLDGPFDIDVFGFSALSAAANKHSLGEVANIVQHPDGRLKEVVLRENRLVSRLSHVLHYVADTEPGSSGSPVFNNQWQAIALHHWGGPWRQTHASDGQPVPRFVNEGVRISAIVGELEHRLGEVPPSLRTRLEDALEHGERTEGVPVSPPTEPSDPGVAGIEVRPDGTAVWRVPIEISVAIPQVSPPQPSARTSASVAAPAAGAGDVRTEAFRRALDTNYENRKGYRESFLPGHVIGLPRMSEELESRAARNLHAETGDDPYELPYQHFSVYVDGSRGLPLVTACNIDGKELKSIDRRTGRVNRAERIADDSAVPEARERWYLDPRIDPDLCGNDELYLSQQVSPGRYRLGRIFHRGHMVRRLDPCWGSDRIALRAEADTLHFTNCTPQVGRFNSGQTLWQGIENHVLDNARIDDLRVCVFTGPVLADDDPPYREDVFPDFKVPLKFFKLAVWSDGGTLRSLALLADQSPSLQEIPEGAEDIADTEEVEEFLSTVAEIESLTGLDFGEAVRRADLSSGEGEGAEAARSRRLPSLDGIRLR